MIIDKFIQINEILDEYKQRDRIILSQKWRTATPQRVNLHYWKKNKREENLGDYLAVVVTKYMCKVNRIDTTKKMDSTRHLYSIGSILQTGLQDATVWGSGLISEPKFCSFWWISKRLFQHYDIRAVRGPLTREWMIRGGYSCPEVFGDPAILMPLVYCPPKVDKQNDYVVIKHLSDQTNIPDEMCVNILTKDYTTVINRIVGAKKVVSSSLHGIILAEVYGIPAVLYLPKYLNNSVFKYRDYYESTDRHSFPIAKSVEEALLMEAPELPDFTKLREGLIESFPVDLFYNK